MTMYTDPTGTTLATLSEALRAHLHEYRVPEPAMVTFHLAAFLGSLRDHRTPAAEAIV